MEPTTKQTICNLLQDIYTNVDWVCGSNQEDLNPVNKERLLSSLDKLDTLHHIILEG
jgi:hypothetical protein